jgi:hypothetical protein
VHWKVKGRELITKGMLNHDPEDLEKYGPRPKQDEWREREFETWIDFPTQRVRNESRGTIHHSPGDGTNPLVPEHEVKLFDGKSLQSYNVLTDGLMELDAGGQSLGLVFEGGVVPLFWGVGIVFGPDTPFRVNEFNNRLDPQKFRIITVERDADVTLLTVRTNLYPGKPAHLDLNIAVEREGAILSKSSTSNGRLNSEMTVEWSQTELGWQPVSWRDQSYRLDGTLAIAGEFEVLERTCSPDLSSVVFHIVPQTGKAYLDVKSRTTYVKSPEGQPDVPKELYDIQQAAQQRRSRWLFSAAILLLGFGGAAWWWRRRVAAE